MLATLEDEEVEARWRRAIAEGDQESLTALARQLALRALPVIEQTCWRRGQQVGLDRCECEWAIEEAVLKLFLRLLHDGRWVRLGAVAASVASGCMNRPTRKRGEAAAIVPLQPRLRLVASGESVGEQGEVDDHGR